MRGTPGGFRLASLIMLLAVPPIGAQETSGTSTRPHRSEGGPAIRKLDQADTITERPDSTVVGDATLRSAIDRTGLPWHVRRHATGIEMMLIPPGTYRRGGSDGDPMAFPDEWPTHLVTITAPFYLGRFEITNAQLRPGKSDHDRPRDLRSALEDAERPAVDVTWNDATAFLSSHDLRLPTEAEWEYACRAGTNGATHAPLDAIGWHYGNSGATSHPVGRKAANGFGLHDMIGNTWEWCSDWYDPAEYGRHPAGVLDPKGPPAGTGRVLRGGSWDKGPRFCRASYRNWDSPKFVSADYGFRAAWTPP